MQFRVVSWIVLLNAAAATVHEATLDNTKRIEGCTAIEHRAWEPTSVCMFIARHAALGVICARHTVSIELEKDLTAAVRIDHDFSLPMQTSEVVC